MNTLDDAQMRTYAKIAAAAAVSLLLLSESFFTVSEGRQALVVRFGALQRDLSAPGLYAKWPMIDAVLPIDGRLLEAAIDRSEIIAADKKRLTVDAFIKYRVVDAKAFYRTTGNFTALENRLRTQLGAALRRVLARESALNIISSARQRLTDEIAAQMREEVKVLGIEAVDVRIQRADLPQANSEAVYRRMQSERKREAEQFRAEGAEQARLIRAGADRTATVIIAEAKRDGEILRGEGEGERNRIFAEAFGRDPQFFSFYRGLEAYRNVFADGERNTFVLSPDMPWLKALTEGAKKQP